MTLFIILLALLIEHYGGVPDNMRNLGWLPLYVQVLESRCSRYSFWDGPGGVLITLAGPMLLIAVLVWVLLNVFFPMAVVVSLVCLLYALGPGHLNAQLDDYVRALDADDMSRIQQLTAELSTAEEGGGGLSERNLLEGILLHAHDRLFGVLFWFIVLGPSGAILYRLAATLRHDRREMHSNYAESVRTLYNILDWPAARLLALGNALTGNMVDAMEAWREVEQKSFAVNEHVIRASGMGALNYRKPEDKNEILLEERIYWIRSLQGMLNRTLLVWLTVLGIVTLSGWLG
jgi:membrane protein required for beta-lactamase induction